MSNERDASTEHHDLSTTVLDVVRMLVSVALIGGLIVLVVIFAVAVV